MPFNVFLKRAVCQGNKHNTEMILIPFFTLTVTRMKLNSTRESPVLVQLQRMGTQNKMYYVQIENLQDIDK